MAGRKTTAADAPATATEKQVAAEVANAEAVGSEDHKRAAEKRAAAAAGVDARTANEIAGLLEERRGYVNRGLEDRIRQVDEQLELRGHKPQAGEQ